MNYYLDTSTEKLIFLKDKMCRSIGLVVVLLALVSLCQCSNSEHFFNIKPDISEVVSAELVWISQLLKEWSINNTSFKSN